MIRDLTLWQGLFPDLSQEFAKMERLLNNLVNDSLDRGNFSVTVGFPKCNIIETDNEYEIKFGVAGFDKGDVDITVKDNTLVIKGSIKETEDKRSKKIHLRELTQRDFERVLILPKEADKEKLEAKYEKGILLITIPKKEEAKPKEIKVKIN